MLEIVTGTSALNGSSEVTLATLTAWHPLVDVWIDATTDPNVADAVFRLYAVTAATATLIVGATLSGPGPGKRLLANVPGQGITIELRALSRRGNTAPVTAALAGYSSDDGPGPTSLTASVGPLANGATAMPIVGLAWNPLVDAFVQGPSPAAGAEWTLFANIAGFGAPVAVNGNPFIDVNPSNAVAHVLGGATSWSLRVAAIAGPMPAVTCSLVSTPMNGPFGTGPVGPPGPMSTQVVYVNKGGSDTTGDGSFAKPFLTIQHALTSITDASTAKRYEVSVGPGEYVDPFQIKPWIAVVGVTSGADGATPNGFAITEITAPADTCGLDPSFSTSGFGVGWCAFLGFTNHQTWDQASAPAGQPQLNFEQCVFANGASYLGPATTGTDNVMWKGCLSYNGVTVKGWQFFWAQEATFLGGTILIGTPAAGSTENTTFLAQDSSIGATLSPTNVTIQTPADAPHIAKGDLSNSSIVGTLILDGAATTFAATAEGIPPAVVVLNGASGPVQKTYPNAIGFGPYYAANQAQTAWFFDPQNVSGHANDANDGLTSTTPLRTWAQYILRVGTTSPSIRANTTFTFLSSHTDNSDPVDFSPLIYNSAVAVITGTKTQVWTGALAGVVPKNRATPQLLQATLPAGAAQNQLVINSTNGSSAFIYTSAGGANWHLAQPFLSGVGTLSTNFFPTEDDGWINTNVVTGYSLSGINFARLAPIAIDGFPTVLGGLYVTDCVGIDPTGAPASAGSTMIAGGGLILLDCQMLKSVEYTEALTDTQPSSFIASQNCVFVSAGVDGGGSSGTVVVFAGGVFGATNVVGITGGGWRLLLDAILAWDVFADTGFNAISQVYSEAGRKIQVQGNLSSFTPGPAVWGPGGQIDVVANGRVVNAIGGTFAANYLQGAATPWTIHGSANGSSSIPGAPTVINGNIAITNAHLDAAAGVAGFGGTALANNLSGGSITNTQ